MPERKRKRKEKVRECTSCGAILEADVTTCPICNVNLAPESVPVATTEVVTEEESKSIHDSLMSKLITWSAAGYSVENLQRLVEEDETKAEAEVKVIERNIPKLDALRKRLSEIDVRGLEAKAKETMEILNNPYAVDLAEEKITELQHLSATQSLREDLAEIKKLKGFEGDAKRVEEMLTDPAMVKDAERELKKLKLKVRERFFESEFMTALQPRTAPAPVKINAVQVHKEKRKAMQIEDLFLLYKDMRLISHHTKMAEDSRDPKFKFRILKAVRDFARHSSQFKPNVLGQTKFEGNNVLVQGGHEIIIGMSVKGDVHVLTEKVLQRVISIIERKWDIDLKRWAAGQGELKETSKVMNSLMVAFAKLSE